MEIIDFRVISPKRMDGVRIKGVGEIRGQSTRDWCKRSLRLFLIDYFHCIVCNMVSQYGPD